MVKFEFNPATTLLDVTANGDDDAVYEISSGKLLLTLTDTRQARFSLDGSLLIGGNFKHLIVWNTKDWSKVSDVPNGPEYVRRIAAFSQKDLAVVGGPKAVRLVRISSALGNGTLALSPDNRWLAAAPLDGSLEVSVWNLSSALKTCGASASTADH